MGSSEIIRRIDLDGYALLDGVFDQSEVERLIRLVEAELASETSRGGVRNLLEFAPMRNLAGCLKLRKLVDPILGSDAKAVRGILFDKTSDANWKVPWHQDVTIAVSRRVEAAGYGPWSTKAGVLHVQPPAEVLERMISVRVHLDDCPEENGALRVVAGSHRMGKLPAILPDDALDQDRMVVCGVRSGGVLMMRPLLVHASSAASQPVHRRVLHFDYAAAMLPVEWGGPSIRRRRCGWR